MHMEQKPGQIQPRLVLVAIFAISVLPIAAVITFPVQLNHVLEPASYLVFHNFTEFFSIMVSLSIFGVGWYAYDQNQDRHALFLAAVFLAIGLLDFLHTMGNAAMPAFITPNSSNKSTQYWIAVRLFQAVTLLASAFIFPQRRSLWLSKKVLLPAAIAVPGLVFACVTFFPQLMPDTFVPGVGLTPFKKFSEYLVVILLCLTAAAYWRRMAQTSDQAMLYYMAACIIGMFSEAAFAVYTRAFDTYNVLGHVYKVAAFAMIYKGIFIASVTSPYTRLAAMSVSRDELRREMEERRLVQMELARSEEKFRTLFSTMTEGFALHDIVLDPEGRPCDYRFLELNDAFERLTGLTRAAILGKRVKQVLPDTESYWIETFGKVALTGEPAYFENYSAALGKWYGVYAYSPAKNQFAVLVTDTTRRKKGEEELLKLSGEMAARNLELEAVNKELESFVYSVSHDLRAPLRYISGFAKILLKNYTGKLDSQADDFLTRIYNASEKMNQRIEALLHLAKLSRQGLNLSEVNLSRMAAQIVCDLKHANPGREVKVTIAEGLVARVDRQLIQAALANLFENAWKFTAKTTDASIEFGTCDRDGRTFYFLRDNGAGFDPQYADRIFWPFHRLHTEHEFEGSGIGLAIVERIIQRHGGEIRADGEAGKGAAFYFTLG
ncbi:MAG: MASE3 domain-containing protein [Desulfurivibrionaceae bacterium]